MKLVPEIQKILNEAAEVDTRIRQITSGLSTEQLLWRKAPNTWSITDVLTHLRLIADVFTPTADSAIADARAKSWFSDGPFDIGLKGRIFLWYVEPPPKIKLPAPKRIVPAPVAHPAEALDGFWKAQQSMMARVQQANGLDLVRVRIQSPLASIVKMNLLTLFRVYTAHERRHVWQMENIRKLSER